MLVSSETRGAWRPLLGRRVLLLCIALLGSACTTAVHRESAALGTVALPWDAALAERILALDPERLRHCLQLMRAGAALPSLDRRNHRFVQPRTR